MEMGFNEKFNQTQFSLNPRSMKKIQSIINPLKTDKNQLILKRVIALFYQVNPIEDFDPVEQFELIEKIPITQQKFCDLMTQVLFKKTKSLFALKLNYQSFIKSTEKDINKSQQIKNTQKKQHPLETFGKVKKSEYIVQNGQKILCEILMKIRSACSRLQQLIYRMIDIQGWKCQSKNNCTGTYLQGHIAKILFKKLILPYESFKRQFDLVKSLMEQKQLRCENKTDIESLKYEIQKWGEELLNLISQQNCIQVGLDNKPSSQIKYFLCRSCYYGKKQGKLKESQQQVNKKKAKKKKKKKDIEGSFSHSSQGNSRKDSLLSFEDKSTTDEIDEQFKSIEQKNYQRLCKFLEDLKIDVDNRIQMRLYIDEDDFNFNHQIPRNNSLKQRLKTILYKSNN